VISPMSVAANFSFFISDNNIGAIAAVRSLATAPEHRNRDRPPGQ